jgi:CubicO group peptidase (beta-lactamase class C family)
MSTRRCTSSTRRARRLPLVLALAVCASSPAPGDEPSYSYHRPTELLVMRGMQALMTCNGLFVSMRTLDQIYAQELLFNRIVIVPPEMVRIDSTRRTVAVGIGGNDPVSVMRAAYREGLGCVVLGPEQDFDAVDSLPVLDLSAPAGDPAGIPWPAGDLIAAKPLPASVDPAALEAAATFAFDRATHGHFSQITLSLLVVHDGDIVLERYAPGVDVTTRTRTWSVAKSIAATLIGIAVDEGRLALDAPLPFEDWGTGADSPPSPADPRRAVRLRHLLNMSSGLYPVDNELCDVIGSCLGYFAGASSVAGALDRGLVRPPGEYWDYENYDTLLAVYALKRALGDERSYLEYPRRALFDRIGMRSTVAGVDRFGDFVLSSQVYTNARDLARLGLLYLNEGRWHGEQILPRSWIEFVRTPAPSTVKQQSQYGGQWWLAPAGRRDVPADAYAMVGSRGQQVIVVPSRRLVIVRRGLDWLPQEHPNPPWDLTREVVKAFGR